MRHYIKPIDNILLMSYNTYVWKCRLKVWQQFAKLSGTKKPVWVRPPPLPPKSIDNLPISCIIKNMRKVRLENGNFINVTEDLYNKLVEEGDDSKFYESASKGRIRISEMEDNHLRNAILKAFREEIIKLSERLRNFELEQVVDILLSGGVHINDVQLNALLKEASERA